MIFIKNYFHVFFDFCVVFHYNFDTYLLVSGRLAQLVEHQSYKLGVTGSSPVPPTMILKFFIPR